LIASSAVALIVACALGLTLAFEFGSESTWWIELLRYAPFLAYLLPAFVVLGLTLWLGWTWRVAAVGAVSLMMTQVMGLSLGLGKAAEIPEAAATAPADPASVRMMTYNIKSYRAASRRDGFDQIAEEIGGHDPDIIVMQDAHELVNSGLPQEMLAVLPHRKFYSNGQYVVASRYPLRDCKPGDIAFGSGKQTYVRCTVTVAGNPVDLFVAHFITPREGLNAARHEQIGGMDDWQQNFASRLTQAHKLETDLIKRDRHRPVIVAGDLNAAEHSPVVQNLLATGLRDAFSTAGVGYGYTVGHALKPGLSFLRIDHILVSPEIGVRSCITGWRGASEHRPVIADLVLPSAKMGSK
jgi:endonuclease/exonuclease/phosphatase family metal-dependent hydrolase